jgi:eukaryotic-like serine/threonine-protein kinase
MAPECILGEDVSPLMDFWSFGILAFECLTGNLPFNSDTPEAIFKNILKKPIDFP